MLDITEFEMREYYQVSHPATLLERKDERGRYQQRKCSLAKVETVPSNTSVLLPFRLRKLEN